MIEGALILVIGLAVGFFFGRLERKRYRPVQAICGCQHHRSYHAEDDRQCRIKDNYGSQYCGCQRYVPREDPTALRVQQQAKDLQVIAKSLRHKD